MSSSDARRGMFRVESIEDQMRDVVTFEIEPSGERVVFDGKMARELGAAGLKKYLGMAPSTGRLPVKQAGQIVGTLPEDFDPLFIKSTNFFYDPRSGDFVLRDGAWEACPRLGPGDLEAVPGFVWQHD
jgi:hypothetical protein